jgi:cobalt/nickel transport system ATP-binding protein
VLVLDGGKLVADGSASELLSHPEIIENHGLEIPYRLRR